VVFLLALFVGEVVSLGEAVHVFQLFLKRFHDDRYIPEGFIEHIGLVRLLHISDILVNVLQLLLHGFEEALL
jgi:hypothetical protein